MKASLQLNLSQQLTLTPQLQQAIRLLQLSTLELQTEIRDAVESNPMLEMDDMQSTTSSDGSDNQPHSAANKSETPQQDISEHTAAGQEEFYPNHSASRNSHATDFNFDNINAAPEDLRDHLKWQLTLTPMSERDQSIAYMIIDTISDDGFLTTPVEEIVQNLVSIDREDPIALDEVNAVLHLIQRFDPVGVGAHDIRECLLIQIDNLSEDTPWRTEARQIVKQHIELLGQRHYTQLMRLTQLSEPQLELAIGLIRSLHPKPGALIAEPKSEYVIPDVLVSKQKNQWVVRLNPEAIPRVSINKHYSNLTSQTHSKSDHSFIRSHMQEAKWLIKSLQSRHDTLLRVANFIVHYQKDFFEKGDIAMKPLILNQVAEALELHESTISRVTTHKYMFTSQGVYELKHFFSNQVDTQAGEETSATAIRAMIKQLVKEENTMKPLSDQKISTLLREKDIHVARRTVAKYREALAILPSHERKRMK